MRLDEEHIQNAEADETFDRFIGQFRAAPLLNFTAPSGEPVRTVMNTGSYDSLYRNIGVVVIDLFPSDEELAEHPELRALRDDEDQRETEGLPLPGSFGSVSVQWVQNELGETGLLIDEIQASPGFYRIKKDAKDYYQAWKKALVMRILQFAASSGVRNFYASSAKRMSGKYPSMSRGNLYQHYIYPFQGWWGKDSFVYANHTFKFWHLSASAEEIERLLAAESPALLGATERSEMRGEGGFNESEPSGNGGVALAMARIFPLMIAHAHSLRGTEPEERLKAQIRGDLRLLGARGKARFLNNPETGQMSLLARLRAKEDSPAEDVRREVWEFWGREVKRAWEIAREVSGQRRYFEINLEPFQRLEIAGLNLSAGKDTDLSIEVEWLEDRGSGPEARLIFKSGSGDVLLTPRSRWLKGLLARDMFEEGIPRELKPFVDHAGEMVPGYLEPYRKAEQTGWRGMRYAVQLKAREPRPGQSESNAYHFTFFNPKGISDSGLAELAIRIEKIDKNGVVIKIEEQELPGAVIRHKDHLGDLIREWKGPAKDVLPEIKVSNGPQIRQDLAEHFKLIEEGKIIPGASYLVSADLGKSEIAAVFDRGRSETGMPFLHFYRDHSDELTGNMFPLFSLGKAKPAGEPRTSARYRATFTEEERQAFFRGPSKTLTQIDHLRDAVLDRAQLPAGHSLRDSLGDKMRETMALARTELEKAISDSESRIEVAGKQSGVEAAEMRALMERFYEERLSLVALLQDTLTSIRVAVLEAFTAQNGEESSGAGIEKIEKLDVPIAVVTDALKALREKIQGRPDSKDLIDGVLLLWKQKGRKALSAREINRVIVCLKHLMLDPRYFSWPAEENRRGFLRETYYDLQKIALAKKFRDLADQIKGQTEIPLAAVIRLSELIDNLFLYYKESRFMDVLKARAMPLDTRQAISVYPIWTGGLLMLPEGAGAASEAVWESGTGASFVAGEFGMPADPYNVGPRAGKNKGPAVLMVPSKTGYPNEHQLDSFLSDRRKLQELYPDIGKIWLGTFDGEGRVRLFAPKAVADSPEKSVKVYAPVKVLLSDIGEVFNQTISPFFADNVPRDFRARKAWVEGRADFAKKLLPEVGKLYGETLAREVLGEASRRYRQSILDLKDKRYERYSAFGNEISRIQYSMGLFMGEWIAARRYPFADYFSPVVIEGFSEPWPDLKPAPAEEETAAIADYGPQAEELAKRMFGQAQRNNQCRDAAGNLASLPDLTAFALAYLKSGGKSTVPGFRDAWNRTTDMIKKLNAAAKDPKALRSLLEQFKDEAGFSGLLERDRNLSGRFDHLERFAAWQERVKRTGEKFRRTGEAKYTLGQAENDREELEALAAEAAEVSEFFREEKDFQSVLVTAMRELLQDFTQFMAVALRLFTGAKDEETPEIPALEAMIVEWLAAQTGSLQADRPKDADRSEMRSETNVSDTGKNLGTGGSEMRSESEISPEEFSLTARAVLDAIRAVHQTRRDMDAGKFEAAAKVLGPFVTAEGVRAPLSGFALAETLAALYGEVQAGWQREKETFRIRQADAYREMESLIAAVAKDLDSHAELNGFEALEKMSLLQARLREKQFFFDEFAGLAGLRAGFDQVLRDVEISQKALDEIRKMFDVLNSRQMPSYETIMANAEEALNSSREVLKLLNTQGTLAWRKTLIAERIGFFDEIVQRTLRRSLEDAVKAGTEAVDRVLKMAEEFRHPGLSAEDLALKDLWFGHAGWDEVFGDWNGGLTRQKEILDLEKKLSAWSEKRIEKVTDWAGVMDEIESLWRETAGIIPAGAEGEPLWYGEWRDSFRALREEMISRLSIHFITQIDERNQNYRAADDGFLEEVDQLLFFSKRVLSMLAEFPDHHEIFEEAYQKLWKRSVKLEQADTLVIRDPESGHRYEMYFNYTSEGVLSLRVTLPSGDIAMDGQWLGRSGKAGNWQQKLLAQLGESPKSNGRERSFVLTIPRRPSAVPADKADVIGILGFSSKARMDREEIERTGDEVSALREFLLRFPVVVERVRIVDTFSARLRVSGDENVRIEVKKGHFVRPKPSVPASAKSAFEREIEAGISPQNHETWDGETWKAKVVWLLSNLVDGEARDALSENDRRAVDTAYRSYITHYSGFLPEGTRMLSAREYYEKYAALALPDPQRRAEREAMAADLKETFLDLAIIIHRIIKSYRVDRSAGEPKGPEKSVTEISTVEGRRDFYRATFGAFERETAFDLIHVMRPGLVVLPDTEETADTLFCLFPFLFFRELGYEPLQRASRLAYNFLALDNSVVSVSIRPPGEAGEPSYVIVEFQNETAGRQGRFWRFFLLKKPLPALPEQNEHTPEFIREHFAMTPEEITSELGSITLGPEDSARRRFEVARILYDAVHGGRVLGQAHYRLLSNDGAKRLARFSRRGEDAAAIEEAEAMQKYYEHRWQMDGAKCPKKDSILFCGIGSSMPGLFDCLPAMGPAV
jgi:hypothetical protein